LGDFQLQDINLRLEQGEYFVLLGPSGVGKTVLLEIVAGLILPDTGAVRWNGLDITRLPSDRRRFSLVYQDYALFPHLSVLGNIAYGLTAARRRAEEARARARQTAELLGIAHLASRRPMSLSGGEKQRVALARALATEPQMLLLDEPLAALDANVRAQLRQVLRDIHRNNGATSLHVTHDVEEALSLGDRIGVMLDGRIHQVGTSEQTFQRPSDPRVARFLGLKNVLKVDEVSDGVCIVDGVAINVPGVAPSVAHLWIRPEEILLSPAPFASSARNQFPCRVLEWERGGNLFSVRVAIQSLHLAAMITPVSFRELGVEVGAELYCTFKSSALHCLG